jgi:hypothetical protein
VADTASAKHQWTKSMASLAKHLDDALASLPDPDSAPSSTTAHSEVKQSVYESAEADSAAVDTNNSNSADDQTPQDGNPYSHTHRPVWSPNR